MRLVLLLLALISTPALADVPAPTSIVIIACQTDDLTGKPGRHGVNPSTGEYDAGQAAHGWRDLELKIINGEYQCKREVIDLVDGSYFGAKQPDELIPLQPNFADWAQCARVGVMQAADYQDRHPGWGVVAVGCPTRIINDKGETVGWQMPSCPTYLPGTNNRMKCRFDESVI